MPGANERQNMPNLCLNTSFFENISWIEKKLVYLHLENKEKEMR